MPKRRVSSAYSGHNGRCTTAGYEMLSFMDGFSGYHQRKMAEEDQEKTTFRTPIGNFSFNVMPFGCPSWKCSSIKLPIEALSFFLLFARAYSWKWGCLISPVYALSKNTISDGSIGWNWSSQLLYIYAETESASRDGSHASK